MPAKAKTISNSSTLFFMGEVLLAQFAPGEVYAFVKIVWAQKCCG
jgi:hypothetical protein